MAVTSAETARPLALVTGASSGIGYELAKLFAEDGYDLLIAADQPAIVEAKQSLEALGVQVTALQLDLSQVDAVDELYAAAAGRPIDALRPTPAMVWDTPSWIRTGTTSCTS